MRRHAALLLVLLIIAPLAAESTGTLTIPNVIGAQPEGRTAASLLDANWNAVRDYVNNREISLAACSTRPAAATSGKYFFCTDTGILYVDTGSAWTQISASPIYTDQLTGLGMSNVSGATATQLNIAAGATASDDATMTSRVLMTLASATQGNTAGTWAVGNFANKLDAGALGASQTWHVFVIQRVDTGVTDMLFSQSATAPTMPTNYTKKRRIGSFLTNAATQIVNFVQDGDLWLWSLGSMPLDVDITNPGTAAVTRTLVNVPTGVKNTALCNVYTQHVATNIELYISSLDQPDLAPSETASPLYSNNTSEAAPARWPTPVEVQTNTLAQIRTRFSLSGAGDVLRIFCYGYRDRRGKG